MQRFYKIYITLYASSIFVCSKTLIFFPRQKKSKWIHEKQFLLQWKTTHTNKCTVIFILSRKHACKATGIIRRKKKFFFWIFISFKNRRREVYFCVWKIYFCIFSHEWLFITTYQRKCPASAFPYACIHMFLSKIVVFLRKVTVSHTCMMQFSLLGVYVLWYFLEELHVTENSSSSWIYYLYAFVQGET